MSTDPISEDLWPAAVFPWPVEVIDQHHEDVKRLLTAVLSDPGAFCTLDHEYQMEADLRKSWDDPTWVGWQALAEKERLKAACDALETGFDGAPE